MKALPYRNRKILDYLISKKEYVPVKEIAKQMQLSEKTIYRDLKLLEEDLKERNIHLKKRPGVGISLVLTDDQILKLSEEISF